MRPGQVERRTRDYTRHGTLSLFAAPDAATGKVIGRCYPRHRGREFLSFVREIERNIPSDLDVHLIMDNYATHKTEPIRWTKSADDILAAIKRFCLKTLEVASAQAEIATNSESRHW
jgi:transposase